jgi:hypothetical protein
MLSCPPILQVLSMAGALKLFKLTSISNKDFSLTEFAKWKKVGLLVVYCVLWTLSLPCTPLCLWALHRC